MKVHNQCQNYKTLILYRHELLHFYTVVGGSEDACLCFNIYLQQVHFTHIYQKLEALCVVPIPVNKQEILPTKRFYPGWSGISHQNNNETCKQNQGAKHETDLEKKRV